MENFIFLIWNEAEFGRKQESLQLQRRKSCMLVLFQRCQIFKQTTESRSGIWSIWDETTNHFCSRWVRL